MVTSKILMQMARRWMKTAGVGRKRISSFNNMDVGVVESVPTPKGHFVVYTNDGKRFVVPLKWLISDIIVELLKMAEDEFGLSSEGPITLSCDASFLEDVTKLMQKRASKSLREAILLSMATRRCSSSYGQVHSSKNDGALLLVY